MRIGKILGEAAGGALTISLLGGVAYTLIALATTAVQDKYFHNIGGKVKASGIELYYKGVEPYNPLIPFPGDDKNGHAEVRLRGSEFVFLWYDNLTGSLEGKMMVKDSEGKKAEFDEKTEYDRKTLEEASELKEALESVGSDKSIRDIVEEEIRQAIAGR